ncbi:DNA replication and repair protein RecF [Dissostichus eleginoides]|uniref:DNA replication and repair protein RecF n=1 Tax=Dissostichus eleginoides TaxID=100907 RepID=A0AAD9FFA7_DISEL|nr:DNA replication and repair protein RecF [Dissostichus eleginoides]
MEMNTITMNQGSVIEDGEHPEEGEEVCVVEKFKGTVPVRILKITHTIVDLLYEFSQSFDSPWDEKIHERESGSFQMMTSSWMNHQIQVHSDRVQLALMKDSSVPGEGREPWATGPTIFEVLDILSEDVNYILCNVLTIYELSDSEFQDLAFESSLEVKQVAAEITELMNKQKSIGNTIRTFLAKEYVKASIHCMVKQTSRMHYQVGAVEKSRRSLQIVVDEVWDVLLKEDGEPEEVEEVCVVQKFKDTVPVRIPEITQTLVDLLFEFVIASSIWQDFVNATWMSSEGVRSKMISDETVIEYQKGIKQDIRRLSESFLKEMSWWMNHQIQVHSERVQLAVIKARYAPPRQSNPFTIPTQVPEVLVAEVRETLVPAAVSGPVYELSDSEFEDLKFESSLEAGQVAGEITELMEQQKSIGNTIRTFLAKEYVKASIHCMATQTRRKFYPAAAAEESRGGWGASRGGRRVCVVQKFKDTVPVRIPEITQTLADLLFEFVTSSCSWHQFASATSFGAACHSWQISDGTVTVPQFHAEMKNYIQDDSRSFLTMMISWMNHQIQVHSDVVQLAIIKASSAPPPQVPEVLVAKLRALLHIKPTKRRFF